MRVPASEWKSPISRYMQAVTDSVPADDKEGTQILGAWQSTVGRLNQAVMLFRYPHMDTALAVKRQTRDMQGLNSKCISIQLLL